MATFIIHRDLKFHKAFESLGIFFIKSSNLLSYFDPLFKLIVLVYNSNTIFLDTLGSLMLNTFSREMNSIIIGKLKEFQSS